MSQTTSTPEFALRSEIHRRQRERGLPESSTIPRAGSVVASAYGKGFWFAAAPGGMWLAGSRGEDPVTTQQALDAFEAWLDEQKANVGRERDERAAKDAADDAELLRERAA